MCGSGGSSGTNLIRWSNSSGISVLLENSKKEVPIKDVDDNLSKPTQDQDLEKIKEPEIVKRMEEEPEMEVKINEGLTDQGNEAEKKDVEMDGFKVVRAAKTEKAGDLFPERKGDYHFPPMELLMEPPEEEAIGDEDHILKAKRLQDTLKEFKSLASRMIERNQVVLLPFKSFESKNRSRDFRKKTVSFRVLLKTKLKILFCRAINKIF